MKINPLEIGNIIIVICLIIAAYWKRGTANLLMILFVYGTLHFNFSAVSLFFNDWAERLNSFHADGGGGLAKLSTVLIVMVIFFALTVSAIKKLRYLNSFSKKIAFGILCVIGILTIGYILNRKPNDPNAVMQTKNTLALISLFFLSLIGYISADKNDFQNENKIVFWGKVGLVILSIANIVGFYEVFVANTWALTEESTGITVHRASSILFNPNLFAYWASLVYLMYGIGYQLYHSQRKIMMAGLVLSSLSIYLSGARSSSYLLFGLLILSIAMLPKIKHVLTVLVLPVTIFITGLISSILAGPSGGWFNISLLLSRFSSAPKFLINYLLVAYGASSYFSIGLPKEISKSIEGRFSGELTDNAWILVYYDAGAVGEFALLLVFAFLFIWGVRVYISQKNSASVFALLFLVCNFITGVVMRFQIFPVWLFMGIQLVPCLIYWESIKLRANK